MSKRSKTKEQPSSLAALLKRDSSLRAEIEPGLQALGRGHSSQIADPGRRALDSLDFDEATRPQHGSANRWDDLIGLAPHEAGEAPTDGGVIGVEVHSASDGEVSVVIAKKAFSKPILLNEMDGRPIKRWIWLASGKVAFSRNSKYLRQLATAGIEFEGKRLAL